MAGTFDIIHVGHIRFLEAAKKLAENAELIVVVARDSTVKKMKGRSPIFPEKERQELVNALKPVDKAVLGYENRHILDILLDLRPDIIALGYDQKIKEDYIERWCKEHGLSVKVIRLRKFNATIDSSSKVRDRIKSIIGNSPLKKTHQKDSIGA